MSGALILLAAVTTSISGFSRLAYSLGEHGQLPRSFGRLSRRALVSPLAIVCGRDLASAIVIATAFFRRDVQFLASLFSFGVLLAFTAAQLAVIKLRIDEPDLPRPVPGAVQRPDPRRRHPAARDRRLDPHLRDLGDRDRRRIQAPATPARPGSRSGWSSSSPSGPRTARG